MTQIVQYSLSKHIARVQIDQPERRNALSNATVEAICEALERARKDRVRVVVLSANTDGRTWAAGQDIDELAVDGSDPEGWDSSMRRLIRSVRAVHVPVIAQVDGGVWGGAVELVLNCDIIVASEKSSFAITPAMVGVPYSLTGLANLSRAVGRALLREMLFTGRPITAQRAFEAGLINYVLSEDELAGLVDDMAAGIASRSPSGLRALKATLQATETDAVLSPELAEQVAAARRDAFRSEDYQEGIAAFKEKRKPKFNDR